MKESIGNRIKLLINKHCNGRNTIFAQSVDTSESNIRNYISDKSQPKISTITNIVKKYNVSYDWLIEGEERTEIVNTIAEEPASYSTKETDPDDTIYNIIKNIDEYIDSPFLPVLTNIIFQKAKADNLIKAIQSLEKEKQKS